MEPQETPWSTEILTYGRREQVFIGHLLLCLRGTGLEHQADLDKSPRQVEKVDSDGFSTYLVTLPNSPLHSCNYLVN